MSCPTAYKNRMKYLEWPVRSLAICEKTKDRSKIKCQRQAKKLVQAAQRLNPISSLSDKYNIYEFPQPSATRYTTHQSTFKNTHIHTLPTVDGSNNTKCKSSNYASRHAQLMCTLSHQNRQYKQAHVTEYRDAAWCIAQHHNMTEPAFVNTTNEYRFPPFRIH